jgi:hypothetical protein
MSIEIELRDNRWYCPVVRCDVCREVIEDARKGNAYYKPKALGHVYHAHKACDRRFEADFGRMHYHTLRHHLFCLLRNSGLEPTDRKMMGEIGEDVDLLATL